MQFMTNEFKRLIKERLKVGELAKPICRVEVDKMVFVPGKVDKLVLEEFKMDTEVRIDRQWIEPNADGTYSGSTSTPSEGIVFPVQGLSLVNMTSGFGMRGGKMHYGIDFAGSSGEYPLRGRGMPVVAAWSGKVVKIHEDPASGKYVVVDHDNGKRTQYLHLHTVNVITGARVEAGQKLGGMGNTGEVRAGGKAVKGTVGNPNTSRGKGLGTHLHFEIHEPNGKGGYRKVDPLPYLKNEVKASKPSVSEGEGAFIGPLPLVGVPGRVVAREEFLLRNWHERDIYSFGAGFKEFSQLEFKKVGGVANWNTVKFNDSSIASKLDTHFTISVAMKTEGFLSLAFRSNFKVSEGDSFYIEVNGDRRAANVIKFEGINTIQELEKLYLPTGQLKIKFGVKWGGKFGKKNPPVPGGVVANNEFKQISLGRIVIQEIEQTTEINRNTYGQAGHSVKQEELSNVQKGYWEEKEVTDFIFTSAPQTFDLTVGDFVYSETMVLDNVMSVDIATSLEQDSSEAVITLANVNGYYSPDFNPHSFPEMNIRTPFSSVMAGYQVGVLSNNTPIRIYMGYGNNEMRVFTGLIDKTDLTGNPPTITITARDMYKKISDKVLTETKKYPDINYIENVPSTVHQSNNEFVNSIAPSIVSVSKTNSIIPSVAIAQAILESGWGKYFKGNNIFGIKKGSSWTGPTIDITTTEYINGVPKTVVATFRKYDSLEASVQDHQKLLTTLPRYAPVLAATNYKDAARALQTAGFATDPEYANKLISIIEGHGLTNYDNGGSTGTITEPGSSNLTEDEKVAWLKSAVVQDLVAHAGMFGWRAHAEDMQYPDAIIEESYLIAIDQVKGTFIRAIPGKEGEFETVKLDAVPTPKGWMNPYTDEYGRTFQQYDVRIGEAISEVLEDTHYRSYCDRYGTYRLETPNYNKPVSETYMDGENIITIEKTLDFSRARSHLIIRDENDLMSSFMDKEILMEVKGELRTASIEVPWAKTYELKKVVATRSFQDMKRICRTLQVAVPCNPATDLLDKIRVYDRNTSTNTVYTIKGIRRAYSPEGGLVQYLELYWAEDGAVV